MINKNQFERLKKKKKEKTPQDQEKELSILFVLEEQEFIFHSSAASMIHQELFEVMVVICMRDVRRRLNSFTAIITLPFTFLYAEVNTEHTEPTSSPSCVPASQQATTSRSVGSDALGSTRTDSVRPHSARITQTTGWSSTLRFCNSRVMINHYAIRSLLSQSLVG